MSKLPINFKELYADRDLTIRKDDFNFGINQMPPEEWVQVNKYAGNSRYLPIGRVEWLLKSIFKDYRIEVKSLGQMFNAVYCEVRVHYLHPVTNEWSWHDGVGAHELQVKAGSSPAQLENLNKGAVAMALPIAKSQAIKDACDHLGKLFGSDLNRKEQIAYVQDFTLKPMTPKHPLWDKAVQALKDGTANIEAIETKYILSDENRQKLCELSS
jgi:hypothetical protein